MIRLIMDIFDNSLFMFTLLGIQGIAFLYYKAGHPQKFMKLIPSTDNCSGQPGRLRLQEFCETRHEVLPPLIVTEYLSTLYPSDHDVLKPTGCLRLILA